MIQRTLSLSSLGRAAVLLSVLLGLVFHAAAVSPPGATLKPASLAERSIAMTKSDAFGPQSFVAFESGLVRPLAISPDAQWLYATNTPDNRVEVFAIIDSGLIHAHSVPVGVEPIALALAPGRDQLWVVNHLSDSISVIDLAQQPPRVVRTLRVADEPRDIVFAGPDFSRAFITAAHRGQHAPFDPQLTTPGIGRADVWVFDVDGGDQPLTVVNLFGDTPRALAVSPNGQSVFAAVFLSGNKTTVLPTAAWPKAPPLDSADGVPQPPSGLIVRHDGTRWTDELGQNWNGSVGMSLPDYDVFEIDAAANPPVEKQRFDGVGTINFNMAVNPQSGALYVSNIDSRNHVRFAGMATRASTTVRGHLADYRVTVIDASGVTPVDLNPHINFNRPFGTESERNRSLSQPMDLVVSADGQTLYLAAFGSQKIAAFSAQDLASGDLSSATRRHAQLSAGGPAGLVLDEGGQRAFVLTRFDNGISIVDLNSMSEVGHHLMPNPEPEAIKAGRPFLYDARLTSSRGNDACSTCHVFGNTDGLAWDLGDPDANVTSIPNDYHPISAGNPELNFTFHPLKGPMTTQSMRGLARHGPMHWRGDRTGVNAQAGESLESAAFKEFNEAFEALMAREEQLDDEQMQMFTDFSLALNYPPNPIRALDNSLTDQEQFGKQLFDFGVIRGDNGVREICLSCHPIDRANGIFGTTGQMAFNGQAPGEVDFKIPHFRDQYQKVGSFSWTRLRPIFAGPQVRGFGFNHNGATHGLNNLESLFVSIDQMEALRAYMYAFDSESPPVLGQQVTVSANASEADLLQYALMLGRAAVSVPVPECDLIGKGLIDGVRRGYTYDRESALFITDHTPDGSLIADSLLALAQEDGNQLTFTCAPWGSGLRMAVDRDQDGVFDFTERLQGSNPADATSTTLLPAAGNWANAERIGHGLDIQRLNDQLIVTWYTYLTDGTPVWYQTSGPLAAEFSAPLRQVRRDPASGELIVEEVGSLELLFSDARNATFNWQLQGESGSEPMALTMIGSGFTTRNGTGMWFDTGEPGWGLSVAAQGQRRAVVVFFHDATGEPRWVIGADDNLPDAQISMLTLTGACPSCDFVASAAEPGGTMLVEVGNGSAGSVSFSLLGRPMDDQPFVREAVALSRLSTDPTNDWP